MNQNNPPGARLSDPMTSKKAEKSASFRKGSQMYRLLKTYSQHADLTDEEAGIYSGLRNFRSCCYWKRCSELRQLGMLDVTLFTRESEAGEQQQVCSISEKGKKYLNQLETAS